MVKLVTGKNLGGSLGRLRRDLEILRGRRDDLVEEHAMVEEEHAELVAQQAIQRAGGRPNNADPPPPAAANGRQRPRPIANNDNNNANANGNGNDEENNGAGRVITITFGLAARNLLSSLFAPIIGHGIGSVLHRWALGNSLGSTIVKRILGLNANGRTNSSWNAPGQWNRGFRPLNQLGLRPAVEDLDPVWCASLVNALYFRLIFVAAKLSLIPFCLSLPSLRWRNAVGMAIYVFAADAISLFHLWLVMRERRYRKIADRGFRGFDLSSLDLVEDPVKD